MATAFSFLSLLIISFFLLTSAETFEEQLDATEAALRSSGYALFGNAIATSDLRYRLLSSDGNTSFTFFSPLDSTLYSLDMTSSATAYTQTLYYHVAPSRHKISDFQNLCYLESLLPHFNILINQNAQNGTLANGIPIVLPDLFVGSEIVVHGLNGILIPGELGFDEPINGSRPLNKSQMSPICFQFLQGSPSPTPSPVSQSNVVSPSPDIHSPRIQPNLDVSPRSSPPETMNRKKKNYDGSGRSNGRNRNGQNENNNHGRFSKFNIPRPDF